MKRRRLGLRARVIGSFAVGALLLSTLLSFATFSITRNNLIESLEREAFNTAETNALAINRQLSSATNVKPEISTVMSQVIVPPGTLQGFLTNSTNQFNDPQVFSEAQLNPLFVRALQAGRPAQMNYLINDSVHHVVGLPIPGESPDAFYVEAAPFTTVEDALNSLVPTLIGAAAVTTLLGMAFGFYASKRLLSPIEEISTAASQVAEGDLSTRLDSESDPDLDQLVQSFNGMTSALEDRIERDARFASDVSHELRSPLMTLTGSVAVLERRRDEMPERAQVALDLLSTDITRFKDLVEDLLEISRFDVGAVQLAKEEVVFGEFVRQAVGQVVTDEEVTIIHDERSEDAFVELDKRRIAQVIRNLCENATKYADGVTQVRLYCEGDDVRIELEDEGPGVPVDERELIFERFARGSEGGRRGSGSGVGLGLSLVTEHLRLHGGTVHVTDRVDGNPGARFVISLPNVVVE